MTLRLRTLAVAALATVFAAVGSVHADVVLTDNFDYPDGDLVGNGGWANHSGTGEFVQVASGAIQLVQGSGSREDVNVAIGATMGAGDVWRYEFDVTVSGTGAATNTYFAHFKDSGSGFNARMFVAAPVAGGDFTFALAEQSGSTPTGTFSNDFVYGQTYRVFAEYNFDLGVSQMWVDSKANGIIASTDADIAQPMEAFAFRQAGGNTSMVIDNLVITAVPEPSALAALGAVSCLLVGAGRRRR